ncbi:MAG: phasin family protein [Alphaproteobacteria bacterium]
MIKNYEELTAAHKGAFDAFMQFHSILAEGFQEITEHVSSLTKQAIEMNIATGKAAAAIKTPQELTALHSNWANQAFGTALDGSIKLSALSTKISAQAVAPIQSHVSSTIGKVTDGIFSATGKAA